MNAPMTIATQDEMPFAAEVETLLRPWSFGELCDKRKQMRAGLVKDFGNAHRFNLLPACDRAADEAFSELLVIFTRPTARRRVKAFRTLCLYTAQRERQAAPDAKPAPRLPP
jgi:hypothetical protein